MNLNLSRLYLVRNLSGQLIFSDKLPPSMQKIGKMRGVEREGEEEQNVSDLVGFDREMEEKRSCLGVLREMREIAKEEMRVLEGFGFIWAGFGVLN